MGDKVSIALGDKLVTVEIKLFDEDSELNIDKILSLDYRNLLKEILTFPVILNRLGFLMAQADNQVKEAELDLRIWKAKKRKVVRQQFEDEIVSKDSGRKKYTLDEVDDEMRSDAVYKVRYKKVYKSMQDAAYMNSIYWAAKSKGDKLQKLSLSLQREIQEGDIDINDLVGEFNGVELYVRKKKI